MDELKRMIAAMRNEEEKRQKEMGEVKKTVDSFREELGENV